MNHYFDTVASRSGRAIPGASVTVYNYPTLTTATIYDIDQNIITNPVTADANGFFEFYVPDGKYKLTASYSGYTSSSITSIGIGNEFISVKEFGAVGDGVTNDTAAIQAAFDRAATLGSGFVIFDPAATYVCNSGLTLNSNKVGIIGNGAALTFAAMTTGDALTITQTEVDSNYRNSLNHAHPITGLIFIGPGMATTAVRCLTIDDNTGSNVSSGITVSNCSFVNFAKDVKIGTGAFCCSFRNCNFTNLSGSATTYSIEVLTGATNAGERNTFTECMWNNRNYILNHTNANANTHFTDCSMDYSTRAFTVTAGAVYVTGGHIENSADSDYYYYVSGGSSLLSFVDVDISTTAAKTTYSPFYSDSTCTNGGIVIRDCRYNQTSTFSVPLVGGTGRTFVENVSFPASTSRSPISAYQNYLAYGGFESANYTAEWTLGGSTPAVRSNAQAHAGTYSLSFPATSTNTPSATLTMPMKPGQFVLGELYYMVSSITGTSGTFYIQVDYIDKGGNSLSSSALLAQTTNVASWTRLPVTFNAPAPAGTVNFKLLINIFGTASGTPTAYVDDVVLNVV